MENLYRHIENGVFHSIKSVMSDMLNIGWFEECNTKIPLAVKLSLIDILSESGSL